MSGKYVFISYKVEEYNAAKAVKDHLEANAIPCWMAPMSIKGGMSYAQEIPPAIENCSVFLLMLSEKAQESKWVPREVDQAINHEKLIMPYMMENCPLRSDFSFYLTNVQRYEAFRDPEETLDRMTRDIQNALGITPPPKTVPAEEPKKEKPKKAKPVKKTVKKEKPPKTKKKALPWLLAGGFLLAILLLILLLSPKKLTVGGVEFKENVFSITLEDKTLSQADVNSLANFTELGMLRLSGCTLDALDLSPLAKSGIVSLELSNCSLTNYQLSTVDFSAMTDLCTLRVNGNPELSELSGISVLAESLTELNISDTAITNFEWLSDFSQLVILCADRTRLNDTTPLESMIYLQTLSLSGNAVSSLEGLKNTSKLAEVDLSHNKLTDVSVLSRSAANLTVLHLENNALTDLSCLSATENLAEVYVDENKLTDLIWQKNNADIRILSASRNEIESVSGLGFKKYISYLDLSHNALSSILEGEISIGTDSYLTLDLCGNKLHTLRLPQNCNFKNLVILQNPDLKISEVTGVKGWNLYFDFSKDEEVQTLKNLSFSNLCGDVIGTG